MDRSKFIAGRGAEKYNCHASKNYYHFVRQEIAPLLPMTAASALEVGAASGATLKWLKSRYTSIETTGVELNGEMWGELKSNVDIALIGPIEGVIPQLKSYDVILLLDVLEHLTDSLGTLIELCSALRPGGTIVVSLPNVAHFSVSVPLLLERRFEYADEGILDRTHVRFFTEQSAVRLLNDAGLTVTNGIVSGFEGSKSRFLDRASLGFLRHHLTKQYIMAAQLTKQPQSKVRWMPVQRVLRNGGRLNEPKFRPKA
jgi:2-polyprenyl-3-methyl-5-hydroxy-6-metoxy-1,4-benzoquinol methylase